MVIFIGDRETATRYYWGIRRLAGAAAIVPLQSADRGGANQPESVSVRRRLQFWKLCLRCRSRCPFLSPSPASLPLPPALPAAALSAGRQRPYRPTAQRQFDNLHDWWPPPQISEMTLFVTALHGGWMSVGPMSARCRRGITYSRLMATLRCRPRPPPRRR